VEIAALAVSLAALGLSGLAIWLADKRTQEARQDLREAAAQALWSDAIVAVNRVMVDPLTNSLTEPLQDLRITFTALADGYRDRPGLGQWLATEHVLGSQLGQLVLAGGPASPTAPVNVHFDRVKPFLDWGAALSSNLRHLRNLGCTPEAVREVHGIAWSTLVKVNKKAGMPPPPEAFAPH
jgi:hypothetical protein